MTVPIHSLTDTWNDGGVTFTAIKMDVTDTASDAASLLMDLQVGGVSKARFSKIGQLLVESPSNGVAADIAVGGTGFGFGKFSTTHVFFIVDDIASCAFSQDGIALPRNYAFAWSSDNSSIGTRDLFLRREAANIFAQRNGVNAQTFNIYNTFTDTSNYERGFAKWNANVFEIGTEEAGTGSARPLSFPGTDIRMANLPTADPTVAGQLWSNSGVVTVSAG